MRTYLQCVPCFMAQTLDAVGMVSDDERLHERVVRKVLKKASEFSFELCPPMMGREIHRIIREETGSSDPYGEFKRRSNEFAMRLLGKLKGLVDASDDPFDASVRLAIAANIIDSGAKPHAETSEEAVEAALREALSQPLDRAMVEELRCALEAADDVLYLADNAGEIVFDGLLIEHMPCEDVTLVVRGSPTINDATMADARQVGLAERLAVIDNGSDAPGTILELCSEQFRRRFQAAGLVLAKGQGNYEALSDANRSIFFLLTAKCPVVARDLGCETGELVIAQRGPVEAVTESAGR